MTEFSTLYGGSLYALAKAEGIDERIYADLALVAEVLEKHPQYVRLLDTPTVALAEKCTLVENAFAQHIHPYTNNFLKILAEKKQMHTFAAVRQAYVKQYNTEHNIEQALAVTAVPMDARLTEKLKAKLEAMTGKTIVLENKVDPAILGGLTIRLANKQIDASVQAKLSALEKQIGLSK